MASSKYKKTILEKLKKKDKENKEKIRELRKSKNELEVKTRVRTRELEGSGADLMNTLEDVEEARKTLAEALKDVGEARKRAEKERDKTKAIITNLADGLLVLNGQNRINLINPEGERLLNVKLKEVEGKIFGPSVKHPSLRKLARLIEEQKSGKGLFRREISLGSPAKTLETTSVSLAPREETVIILHDVSREKSIEKMKTEFVALAAHQLRTPLSAVKWTLKMLLDGDLGEISKEQREFIGKTYQSNERMISLINALLDVTRIEEGRYLFRAIFFQIETIVQFVINSFKEIIEKKKISLVFKKPKKKLPKVKVDVEKIRLAIDNFLDNAIRYTPVGGKVTVSLSYDKKNIEFAIKDNGVGIPKEQQKRVFTKFFRGANVVRMETEGTGLGLFIAKNIIEAHNGKTWFKSEEGKGTTFYFSLPAKK
jgi:signal transduction histidine kinase